MRFPWKRHALAPPRPGYIDYWASVEVRLHEPIPVEDDEEDDIGPMVGYIRNFGVRVKGGQLRSLLEHTILDGDIRWETSECYPVEPDDLDRIVRKRIAAVDPDGIWYVSGRAFYRDDPDEKSGTKQ
jgi:hypothetical protein